MNVIFKAPGQKASTMTITNDLHLLQKLVGGNIEVVTIDSRHKHTDKDIVLICNEEGKLNGMKANFPIGYIRDTIYGPAVFASADGEDFGSLTDHDANLICDVLHKGTL